MEISHFELVYKPQSPSGTADTVLQGYFLEISNLEDFDLQFALRLTTSSISDPDRDLFGNTVVFVDTPSTNNNAGSFTLSGVANSKSYRLNRLITVPAHGTALVAVLPSDPFPPSMVGSAAADFECRGYASLTLPAVFKRSSFGQFGILQAQSDRPVRVLVSAQNRAQYQDPSTGDAKGQTQSSVPLANGNALMEIEPGQPFILDTGGLRPRLDIIDSNPEIAIDFEGTLAGMLASASASGLDLRKFNAAMKEAGIGMAVETRKLSGPQRKPEAVPAE